MEEFIETFHIDWKLMIAQLFNFGLVFLAFYLLAAKPLGKLIKERTLKIEKGLDDAKINAQTLEKTSKEYEETLTKARAEAHKIFQEGKMEAENKKAMMLETAEKDVAGIIEKSKKTLEIEKTKMVAEAKKEVATLVITATEKLLSSKDMFSNEKALKELKNL